jgi:hypothetical protein
VEDKNVVAGLALAGNLVLLGFFFWELGLLNVSFKLLIINYSEILISPERRLQIFKSDIPKYPILGSVPFIQIKTSTRSKW